MAQDYKAFISYTHTDERWAGWLQRSLERYRVPANLKRQGTDELVPNRLHPIFRDRDELASASDLSESIRSALDRAGALIVVCSPYAAQSNWVNEEIRYFQSLNRSNRIFCLIVSGSTKRDAPDCAFPTALLQSEDGLPLPEPLAADLRERGDGKRNAMLKIAAGLIGVGIDDLKQRDAQHRLRVRGAITVASLLIAVTTIGFAIAAQLAREEADLRRIQAENLISFMLGDLRTKLESAGRLDLLDSVGDGAIEYFAVMGDRGTEQEIYSRAIALRQIGEVRFRQGQLVGALEAFEESRNIAETLAGSNPENNQYLFELGQSEFWVGHTALERSELDQTDISFTKYMEISKQLLDAEPENPEYQLELSYAYSNLGTLGVARRELQRALEYFQRSNDLNEKLVAAAPADLGLKDDLALGYSWVGATQLELGHIEESKKAYLLAFNILLELRGISEHRLYSEHFGELAYLLGNVFLNQGNLTEAVSFFDVALDVFTELVAHDPDNAIWRGDRGVSAYHQAEVLLLNDEHDSAREILEQAIDDFMLSVAADPGDVRAVENLALAERLLALLVIEDSIEEALDLSSRAHSRIGEAIDTGTVKPRTVLSSAIVSETHGRILHQAGEDEAADSTWRQALELLTAKGDSGLVQLAVQKQLVIHLQGEDAAAERAAQLAKAGFNDPRFR
jgi:tetratricopeptide (TPR) repeat protein